MKLAFLTLMSIVALDSHASAHELQSNVTRRADIGGHIAYVAQQSKDMVPSIGLDVGDATFIVGLLALEQEAYLKRPTQEQVDMLAEMLGTKPTWWEITQLRGL